MRSEWEISKNSKCCQTNLTSWGPVKGKLRSLLENPIRANPGQGSSPFSLSPQIQMPKVWLFWLSVSHLCLWLQYPAIGCGEALRGEVVTLQTRGMQLCPMLWSPDPSMPLPFLSHSEKLLWRHLLLNGWFALSEQWRWGKLDSFDKEVHCGHDLFLTCWIYKLNLTRLFLRAIKHIVNRTLDWALETGA